MDPAHTHTHTHAHTLCPTAALGKGFALFSPIPFQNFSRKFRFRVSPASPLPSTTTTAAAASGSTSLPRPVPGPRWGMPASMFSIDNILAARPRCKDSVLLPPSAAPVVFPSLHGDSLYGAASDYGGFYSRAVAPGSALPAVGGSRLGYNNYYYGQLHVPASPVGPSCCGAVPPLGAQQCSCVPPAGKGALGRGTGESGLASSGSGGITHEASRGLVCLFVGYEGAGSVLMSPVPHQMLPYMNVGTLSRTELQLLNQLHCRRKRRHRTIFTDEQLEALENLFQETKYPDVGTREQLARRVHLREEKVEVFRSPLSLLFLSTLNAEMPEFGSVGRGESNRFGAGERLRSCERADNAEAAAPRRFSAQSRTRGRPRVRAAPGGQGPALRRAGEGPFPFSNFIASLNRFGSKTAGRNGGGKSGRLPRSQKMHRNGIKRLKRLRRRGKKTGKAIWTPTADAAQGDAPRGL